MHLYYTTAALAAAIVLMAALAWRRQRLAAVRARLMREAMRNRDFTFRLPDDSPLPGDRELQAALNETCAEVGRLMAQSEVESWQRLARVLTHEIMNAVAPIQSIAQAYMASPAVKGTPMEEGIRAIYDTSRSLSAFVASYRKLTQLQKPVMETVSVGRIAANLRQMYPDVMWHATLDDGDTVTADATMLVQVAVNIAKNAVEAGARNIGICTGNTGGDDDTGGHRTTMLLISNDGQPIPPDVAREMFVPFFTTKPSGSGIGLSLARQMMVAAGGDLLLLPTPRPGYHTTFAIVTNM